MKLQRAFMKLRGAILFGVLAFTAFFSGHAAEKISMQENRYYQMVTIPIPQGVALEGGALQFLPDGRLASATRFGDIYIIDNPLQNPPTNVKFTHFASGLHEVLGLVYRDGCRIRGCI